MKTKSIILGGLVSMALVTSGAYAAASFPIKFQKTGGYFSCTFDKGAGAEALIATTHAYVKGPNCDGRGVLHLTADQLKTYAFEYRLDGTNPNARVEVYGNAANLVCVEDQAAKEAFPGGDWCLLPPVKG
ncbi:MAG: hypothetical protein K0S11_54 [Gammaproteobacteria bacterium]|jgi:hypothetical protein|nr:hypothetical protein [Gammaproteobacteria bacterium]